MESYLDVLRVYQNNSGEDAATIQCMGILKGIHKFENERMNDLFEWGLYDNHKKFKQVIEEWRKGNTDPRNLKEMDEFVMENFPEWHEDTLSIDRYSGENHVRAQKYMANNKVNEGFRG